MPVTRSQTRLANIQRQNSITIANLPHEIVALILQVALDEITSTRVWPGAILCVSRLFRDLGRYHLYTHLKITSLHQLQRFASSKSPKPAIAPRSLVIDIPGEACSSWWYLGDILVKCGRLACDQSRVEAKGTLPLDNRDVGLKHIRVRMNTYRVMYEVGTLKQGLQAVSPNTFEWTGTNPNNHTSATHFPSWGNIREIMLTNIGFTTMRPTPDGRYPPLLEDVPSLRTLYIGSASFLRPQMVAGMFCQGRMTHLCKVRLVDVYPFRSMGGSIMRISDIEEAAVAVCPTEEQMSVIARIKKVVTCEKRTERIVNGNRVEEFHVLD